MDAKELIQISREKGYLNISDFDYGFIIQVDNQNLKTKIIDSLEDDEDYSMFKWTKYTVTVFSCEKCHEYFKRFLDGQSKKFIPDEMYDGCMFSHMNKSFEKFNEKYDDIQIKGNIIMDMELVKLEKLRQIEIEEFVNSIK